MFLKILFCLMEKLVAIKCYYHCLVIAHLLLVVQRKCFLRPHSLNYLLLFQVLVDMIRVPDWAFEAAGQELRGMGPDAATYHPGLYLTPTQVQLIFTFNGCDYLITFSVEVLCM